MDLFSTCLLLLGCSIGSFLFSGMEAGFLALNPVRIRRLARSRYRAAETLQQHLDSPEPFLWTILIGNTLANFGWIAMIVYSLRHHASFSLGITLGIATLLFFAFYTFLDLLPKMLVRRFPNRLTILLTYPFEVFFVVLSPLVRLLSALTSLHSSDAKSSTTKRLFQNRDDLRHIMHESAAHFSSGERALITRVMDLQNQTTRSAMKPFHSELTLSPNHTITEAKALCRKTSQSQILLRQQTHGITCTTGIFHLKQVLFESTLNPNTRLRELSKPALTLPDSMPLDEALQQMKITRHRLAVVTHGDHKELGVLSLTDILRSVFHEVDL